MSSDAVAEPGGLRLTFRRTGGLFAGNVLQTTVIEQELSDAQGAELGELLGPVDIDQLAARSPIRGPGADRFQYDLTVERGGQGRRVIVSAGAVPDELAPLIDWLERRATQEREHARG